MNIFTAGDMVRGRASFGDRRGGEAPASGHVAGGEALVVARPLAGHATGRASVTSPKRERVNPGSTTAGRDGGRSVLAGSGRRRGEPGDSLAGASGLYGP